MQALRGIARTLLDSYIGRQSGGRVLEGQIQRGRGETIRAAIWLGELCGFTSLFEALPREALIDLLNCYFGPMCDALSAGCGEVLKFIGDAMLAIFPVGEDVASVCVRRSTLHRTRASPRLRKRTSCAARSSYGLALHIGDVL